MKFSVFLGVFRAHGLELGHKLIAVLSLPYVGLRPVKDHKSVSEGEISEGHSPAENATGIKAKRAQTTLVNVRFPPISSIGKHRETRQPQTHLYDFQQNST